MKTVNQLLRECVDRLDEKEVKARKRKAHDQGIAEARRILANVTEIRKAG